MAAQGRRKAATERLEPEAQALCSALPPDGTDTGSGVSPLVWVAWTHRP